MLFVPAKGQNQELLNTTRRLESFVVNMNNFNRQYPQEKVYLHLDNTGYFMGETLWFKASRTTSPLPSPTRTASTSRARDGLRKAESA